MASGDIIEDNEEYVLATGSDTEETRGPGEKPEVIAKIKEWLLPTEFDSDTSEYKKHLNSHVQGTGQWILATDQYKRWFETDDIGDLWIRGIPGSGKSVVAASLVRDLKNKGDAPVLFFFFRHIIMSNRTPQSLLRDFSFQLQDHSHALQSSLKKVMTAHPSVDEVPIDELWKSFSSALSGMEKVYCVIDALDEMEPGHDAFLEDLLGLGRRNPKSVKIALTSRQLPHLEIHLKGACLVDLRLDRKNVDRDIATYISYRLKHCRDEISDDQSRGIETAICDKGKGLFLYARLMMDQCLHDPAQFVSQLDKLPDGLGNMYTDLLREHAARSATTEEFQKLVLEWVTHSQRPLRILELTAIINSMPNRGGLQPSQDTKMSIRTCCGPLLELCEDQVMQIIHHSLTEFLLNPHALHIQMTSAEAVRFPVLDSVVVHKSIVSACISYLASGCFEHWETLRRNSELLVRHDEPVQNSMGKRRRGFDQAGPKPKVTELVLKFHFLDYAAKYWPIHAEKLSDKDTELFAQLDSFMQIGSQNFESWKDFWDGLKTPLPEGLSPLHVAANCGLAEYTRHLLIQGADPNVADSYQRTPTSYAAMEGHNKTLNTLIEHHARFEDFNARGLAPIHHAAKRNHPAALRVLLNSGADPLIGKSKENLHFSDHNEISTIGQTALYYACDHGHVEALLELEKYLEPSQLLPGLHWAAKKGRGEILKVLLRQQLIQDHVDDKDHNGNTPLFLAAFSRNPASVQILLQHGADVHARSDGEDDKPRRPRYLGPLLRFNKPKLGYTAIHGLMHCNIQMNPHHGSFAEIKEVLALLMEAGSEIDARDEKGRTPLFAWNDRATPENGLAFVSTCLAYGADATATDSDRSTVLHCLSGSLKEREALRLLVDAGADINAVQKSNGETPLITVTRRDQLMDPTLFHEFKADFHRQDVEGNTALHYACSSWCMEAEHADLWLSYADPTIRNNAGRTAASRFNWGNGGQGRLDALLKMVSMGLPLESRDYLGRTLLLQFLAQDNLRGWKQLVTKLLDLGADAKATDYEGKSALHLLARSQLLNHDYGKRDVECFAKFMQELIVAGADVQAVDHGGNSILHAAIGSNRSWRVLKSGVNAMISLGAPVSALNHQGRNALHVAAGTKEHGIEEDYNAVVSTRLDFCLQRHLGFDVNARDYNGNTPLHLAAVTSEVDVWKLIRSGADIQAKTVTGRTVLHFAAEAGECSIVDLLVENFVLNSLSLDTQDLRGRSALHEAARSGRPESVKIILAAGGSPCIKDKRGRTPLHAAAEFEHVPTARTTQRSYDTKDLFEHDGSKYRPLEKPETALDKMDVMISSENDPTCIREVVRLLVSAGNDFAELDASEHTPIDVAVMLGNAAVVEEHCFSDAPKHGAAICALPPLDPIGTWLLSRNQWSTSYDHVSEIAYGIDDPVKIPERLISSGKEDLLEGFVSNRIKSAKDVEKILLGGPDGTSPLHLVARSGLTTMMKILLNTISAVGSNVQAFSPPLLHTALDRSTWNLEMFRLLLKQNVDINAQCSEPPEHDRYRPSPDDRPPQYAAVHVLATGKYWWYPEALRELLEAGADTESLNGCGETALQVALAARAPYTLFGSSRPRGFWCDQTLEVLLKGGASVNFVASETNLTPLNTALESHCGPEIAQKLLDHGADRSFGPKPALASAIDSLDLHSLEILLKAGADPNEVYRSNEIKRREDEAKEETPLQNVAAPGTIYFYDPETDTERIAITKMLLEHGANPNQKLKDGTSTVLHEIAGINGLLKYMLVDGVDLELKDSNGRTPLHRACHLPERYHRVIENDYAALELISAGADINVVDSSGSTALHYAIKSRLAKTIESLLAHGALINLKDNTGTTPLVYTLDTAWSFKDIDALLDAGADPLETAPDGRTPLHFIVPHLMQYSSLDGKDKNCEYCDPEQFPGFTKLYNRLIAAGCSREARDHAGNTPIFPYVGTVKAYSQMEMQWPPDVKDLRKMFEEHDVFKVNHKGDTLLHVVAGREEDFDHQEDGVELFRILVELGLDPSKENKEGVTPLDVAAACGNEKILAIFARDE